LRRVRFSQRIDDRTFHRLDIDGNGVLAGEELVRAGDTLRRFDQNDDDMVIRTELNSQPNITGPGVPNTRTTPVSTVLLLNPDEPRQQLAYQLLSRLDTGRPGGSKVKDQRLSRDEIGLEVEAFAALDENGDERLDREELVPLSRPARTGHRTDHPARACSARSLPGRARRPRSHDGTRRLLAPARVANRRQADCRSSWGTSGSTCRPKT